MTYRLCIGTSRSKAYKNRHLVMASNGVLMAGPAKYPSAAVPPEARR